MNRCLKCLSYAKPALVFSSLALIVFVITFNVDGNLRWVCAVISLILTCVSLIGIGRNWKQFGVTLAKIMLILVGWPYFLVRAIFNSIVGEVGECNFKKKLIIFFTKRPSFYLLLYSLTCFVATGFSAHLVFNLTNETFANLSILALIFFMVMGIVAFIQSISEAGKDWHHYFESVLNCCCCNYKLHKKDIEHNTIQMIPLDSSIYSPDTLVKLDCEKVPPPVPLDDIKAKEEVIINDNNDEIRIDMTKFLKNGTK